VTLIEKLERKRRELDQQVKLSLWNEGYNFRAADMRDLLDEVLATIHAPLMFKGVDTVPEDFYEQLIRTGYVVHRTD